MMDDKKFDLNKIVSMLHKYRGTSGVIVTTVMMTTMAYPWVESIGKIDQNVEEIKILKQDQNELKHQLKKMNVNLRIALCSMENGPDESARRYLGCADFE